jgi:SAM-dependent methyltransferase
LPISHSPHADKWHDVDFVRAWDASPPTPLRAEQLDILATVIKDNWRKGSRILDLGCGTGKAEHHVLQRLPVARFDCVDRSPAMLELARERLDPHAARFFEHDLARLGSLRLPERSYRYIISVNTVHELRPAAQRGLARFCARRLAKTGMLLILDRVRLDRANFGPAYSSVLARLQRIGRTTSGEYSADFATPGNRDDEHPLALEQWSRLLRANGLTPALLHLHCHKALIAARPAR